MIDGVIIDKDIKGHYANLDEVISAGKNIEKHDGKVVQFISVNVSQHYNEQWQLPSTPNMHRLPRLQNRKQLSAI